MRRAGTIERNFVRMTRIRPTDNPFPPFHTRPTLHNVLHKLYTRFFLPPNIWGRGDGERGMWGDGGAAGLKKKKGRIIRKNRYTGFFFCSSTLSSKCSKNLPLNGKLCPIVLPYVHLASISAGFWRMRKIWGSRLLCFLFKWHYLFHPASPPPTPSFCPLLLLLFSVLFVIELKLLKGGFFLFFLFTYCKDFFLPN